MNRKYIICIIVLLILCFMTSFLLGKNYGNHKGQDAPKIQYVTLPELNDTSFRPTGMTRFSPIYIEDGIIPTPQVAVQIAYDYVAAVYGKDCAEREQPYEVQLLNKQVWCIHGSLPLYTLGGAFYISIEKNTGRVLTIVHEK